MDAEKKKMDTEEVQPLSREDIDSFISSSSKDNLPFVEDSIQSNEDENQNLAGMMQEEIEKGRVRNRFIQESTEIEVPSFVIDLTKVAIIQPALEALQSILYGSEEEGKEEKQGDFETAAVYLKVAENKLIWIGLADRYELENSMGRIVQDLFPEGTLLYKNIGNGFQLVRKMDVGHLKLVI